MKKVPLNCGSLMMLFICGIIKIKINIKTLNIKTTGFGYKNKQILEK